MPVHIAVIDDEPDVLDFVNYNLTKEGFTVSTYLSSETALEAFGKEKPDLIISDWMLPSMSGLDLLKHLRSNMDMKWVPFIMVTCHNTSKYIAEALDNGADDYLVKPFKLKELVSRIRKRLNNVDKTEHLQLKEQFTNVVGRNKDLNDSLISAKRIQAAIFPNTLYFTDKYPESFVLNRPKDYVSGDFFWYAEIHGLLVTVVADCTGHGVPGAFTSIMGNIFLNRIVYEKRITDAGTILKELNNMVVSSLNDVSHAETHYEGMDISVAIIDLHKNVMQFSGALHDAWLIRDGNLTELRGTRYPVGGLQIEREKWFHNHELKLLKGDMLYLKTDGYADQFGGNGKKFLKKQLKKELTAIAVQSAAQQYTYLDMTFKNWKANEEQTDDVLVFGIRI